MGLEGWIGVRNLLPDARKPAPLQSHTQMCSRSAASAGEVAMYVLEHISKPSREPLFQPRLFLSAHLLSFSDTPQLAVRWSKAVDRGVCPLISKHSRGAYGENAAEYSLHCVAKLSLA